MVLMYSRQDLDTQCVDRSGVFADRVELGGGLVDARLVACARGSPQSVS